MAVLFDKSRHSIGVQFIKAGLLCVLLYAQTTNSVVFLAPETLFGKRTQLKFEFTIQYGPQAEPVVGIFHVPPNLDDLWLKENPDVSFIDLVSGSLYIRGKKVEGDLPRIKTGAIVTVELSVTSPSMLKVQNPGESFVKSFFDIPEINETDFVNVFAGALQTGRKAIQIDLTNDETADQILPTAENENDIYVNFDRYQGVIEVSKDGKSLSRNATQQGNGYALLSKLLKIGIHKIKFSIESDFGASLCIGVARHPFRLSEDYIKDVMKHIYRHPGLMLWRSYRGLLYCDGKQLEKSTGALGWQHGGSILIELVVNMEERTIELLKDDVSLGTIFTDIPEVVQPVVCFYASYEKAVKLISYTSSVITPKKIPFAQQSIPLPIHDKVHFEPQGKSGLITLTSDRMTVCREKNQGGNSLCLLNVVCEKNCLHRFSFIIEMDQGASVCVGVTNVLNSKDIRINGIGNIFSSPDIYVFRSFQGMLYNKGKELPKHLEEFWMTGSLLEMIIDVNEGQATIQYAINGNDQGIAFSGISTPIKPLVAFYAGMEKRVTLIHYEATPRLVQSVSTEQHDSAYETGIPNRFTRLQSMAVQPDGVYKESIINYKSLVIDTKIKCENCQDPVDCVALPCEHRFLCAKHLCERGNCPCGIHTHKPFKMWNLFY